MLDRSLLLFLSWGLFVVTLVAYRDGFSAVYFAFLWLITGFIDRKLLRREREETYERAGMSQDEVDAKMLPRDRLVTIARAVFAFGFASAFHFNT